MTKNKRSFIKDKSGSAMLIWSLGLIAITFMFIAMQTGVTKIIYEKNRLYVIADEAANKAAWEIYQYQSQSMNANGQIDVNALQAAVNKAADVFKNYGLDLQNPLVHIEGGYLIVNGNVVTKYKEPVTAGKRQVLVRSGYYTNSYIPQTGYNQSVNMYGAGLWGNKVNGWTDYNTKWIWGVENVGSYWFKQSFTLSTQQTVTINATADNTFTLYVDGKQVLSGSNWNTKYSVNLTLSAGSHEIKAYVQNTTVNGIASSFENPDGTPGNPGAFIASITDSNGTVLLRTDENWQLSTDSRNWQDVGMIAPKNMPINYSVPQWVDTSHYEIQDVQPGNDYVNFPIEGRAVLKKIGG